ncbi:SHS2 domain-containing protein [Arenibacter nanhaiticus]|uniref:SHS2 domain-containing protein n=1 Tax=Arenibacter nanhaiticus TaxID=558155 RepID=A0A1M6FL41_9FLAO|nr:archease [Arenibacter nanhaiticus]SHI98431.1 SHS2 domain-containing protein [Arenibacter nanhaiticus]
MKVEYLPHTADIRMRITAAHLQELFHVGIIGMGNILKENFCLQDYPFDQKLKIEITASDPTCLLIDFLSEVLSVSCTEKGIFCKVIFIEFTPIKTIAEIYGKHVFGFDEEIKAVTYHEADIFKNNDGHWETMVVFDI